MTKKRLHKKSALERKSQGITQGVHTSNLSQLKKIAKVDTNKNLPQVPLVDLYMRVNKKWNFKGKSCSLCGSMMTDPVVIDKHRYICKVLNSKRDKDDANT